MPVLARIAFGTHHICRRFDESDGNEWPIYGVFFVDDLRPKQEREADEDK